MRNASCQILFKCPTPAIVFGHATRPSRFAHFWQRAESLAPATQNDRNMLRATTACTFSTSHLPKVVRAWCALYILTWKCASRHNGVQLFISHLARWLRTRRFSEPTFRPSGGTNHWKTHCFATFLPVRAPASAFFWLFLFSDLLLFSSLTLPTSAFPPVHIVGSLTSKLPSIIFIYIYTYVFVYINVHISGWVKVTPPSWRTGSSAPMCRKSRARSSRPIRRAFSARCTLREFFKWRFPANTVPLNHPWKNRIFHHHPEMFHDFSWCSTLVKIGVSMMFHEPSSYWGILIDINQPACSHGH